jgi:GNAT superfamily N-acetyltransferase
MRLIWAAASKILIAYRWEYGMRFDSNDSFGVGAYINGRFAGFTRVVTDTVAFAYVLDLFVLEEHRGKGISRALVEAMLAHEDLQTVSWLLGTQDAHGLYEKYGFNVVEDPRRFMRKPGV